MYQYCISEESDTRKVSGRNESCTSVMHKCTCSSSIYYCSIYCLLTAETNQWICEMFTWIILCVFSNKYQKRNMLIPWNSHMYFRYCTMFVYLEGTGCIFHIFFNPMNAKSSKPPPTCMYMCMLRRRKGKTWPLCQVLYWAQKWKAWLTHLLCSNQQIFIVQ